MPQRRLQDRIENLVVQALAAHDSAELDVVIEQLRQALYEHLRLKLKKKRAA